MNDKDYEEFKECALSRLELLSAPAILGLMGLIMIFVLGL